MNSAPSASATVPVPAATAPVEPLDRAKGHGVLLFDGDCAMCNGFVQKFMTIDPTQAIRYAPLQGETAAEVFKRQGINTKDTELLSGVRLVQNFRQDNETVLTSTDAVLTALSMTESTARHLSVFKLVPRFFREWVYKIIAKNRYRFAGKMQKCAIPQAGQRHLFLP